jgi:DNA (cytosine-5)-methyltransferase 1
VKRNGPIAVDLFAGAGGLTRGLRDAGFVVAVAVEVDAHAARTYRWNNRRTEVIEKDIRLVSPQDIVSAAGNKPIDLIAGCAPCQGFSPLTAKWGRRDHRNDLLLSMAELIRHIQPPAVLMENVPGILQRGGSVFHRFTRMLREIGYTVHWRVEQMADFGVPQSRRRLVLLAGKGFSIPFPNPTHTQAPNSESLLQRWLTVRHAIGGLPPPITLAAARKLGRPKARNWHVVRDLRPQTKARLRAALPGRTWIEVDESIRPHCHRGEYRGFTNVYGRMAWDDISPTITSGCTTPCKGRFGHPDRRRYAISVREAAILQTFPSEYQFLTDHIDQACELIGNAVPPLYARRLGASIRTALLHRRSEALDVQMARKR